MRKIRTRGRQESGDYLPSPKQQGRSEMKAEKQVSRSGLRTGSARYVARHRHGCSAPQQGPELECSSPAKGWGPWMRSLPVLFPAASSKIAKLHCVGLVLEHSPLKYLGGPGERLQSSLVWFRALILSLILKKVW